MALKVKKWCFLVINVKSKMFQKNVFLKNIFLIDAVEF